MIGPLNQTNKQLIDGLFKQGIIKSNLVHEVLAKIDRKHFVPQKPYYEDRPSGIGYGATISAPHMHAFALQFLEKDLLSAKRVLDVGSGTGILTLAMAEMVKPETQVYGIEHVQQLVEISIQNITECNPEFVKSKKIIIKQGDGRQGWPEDKTLKFDVIHVGAAPEKIPVGLMEQLEEGGVMIIPVGGEHETQKFIRGRKVNGKIEEEILTYVRYVPLTDLKHQMSNQ